MSIFLRPGQIKVRDDTGEFTSINVMAETSADEIINDIEAAGREVIESIPSDYTALTEEVDELNERIGNVTGESLNIFNADDVTYDNRGYLDDDGNLVTSYASGHTTNLIPVDSNTKYFMNGSIWHSGAQARVYFYNALREWISRTSAISYNPEGLFFTTPDTCSFICFQYIQADIDFDTVIIAKSNVPLPYMPYETAIDDVARYNIDANKSDIIDLQNNLIETANLLNIETNTINKSVNQYNGNLKDDPNWQASDYIPVTENTDYYFIRWASDTNWKAPNSTFYAFYNSEKVYTHGGFTSDNNKMLSAVTGDKYVRVSASNAMMTTSPMFGKSEDIFELIDSTDFTKYIPFGKKLVNDVYGKITDNFFNVEILLPEKVYIAVGRQITFYDTNYLKCDNPENYSIRWYCGLTAEYIGNGVRFKPNQTGSYNVVVYVYNKYTRQLINTKKVQIIVVADTQRTSKSVIFIGDSLTASGFYPYEIQKHLSNEGMTSLGTRETTAYLDSDPSASSQATVYHEGRGGWSAKDYVTLASKSDVANAFWNPTTSAFDFSYYMTEQNYSTPDVVFLNLGTNGTSDPQGEIDAINEMITSIHAYDNTLPIVVSAIAPDNASDGEYINMYLTRIRELQLENFDEQLENVYVAPIYLNINRVEDWKTHVVAESDRNPKELTVQYDGVHPSKYGYFKFADVYWSIIQYILG